MARSLRSLLGSCLMVSALGMVPPPENVRMNSVNFQNILQWEPPASPKGNLTFTAQYLSFREFQDVCTSIALTECDFSDLSMYGEHSLRVRAELADEHSDWINITFCPVDDTTIGPPRMQVEALATSAYIRFIAPKAAKEHETWTVRSIYDSWVYNVLYWKNGSDEKYLVTTPYDVEVLRDLEPRTTYCIQVQGFLPNRNKTGQWSEPVCEQTIDDDWKVKVQRGGSCSVSIYCLQINSIETALSWVIIAVVLVVSIFVACLLLLGCFALLWYIYKKTKHAFSPGNSLPQHLKEFLGHPHHSRLLFFSFPLSDESEVFDKLSVITEVTESSKQPGDSCSLRTLSGQV